MNDHYVSTQTLTDIRELLRQLADVKDHPDWQFLADQNADGSWLFAWLGDKLLERLFERFGEVVPDYEWDKQT